MVLIRHEEENSSRAYTLKRKIVLRFWSKLCLRVLSISAFVPFRAIIQLLVQCVCQNFALLASITWTFTRSCKVPNQKIPNPASQVCLEHTTQNLLLPLAQSRLLLVANTPMQAPNSKQDPLDSTCQMHSSTLSFYPFSPTIVHTALGLQKDCRQTLGGNIE